MVLHPNMFSLEIKGDSEQELEKQLLLHPRKGGLWEVIFRKKEKAYNYLLSKDALDDWLKKQSQPVQLYIQKHQAIFSGDTQNFANMPKQGSILMGVIDVTSNSDIPSSIDSQVSKGLALMAEGANIIDVKASDLSMKEEKTLLLPIIRELLDAGASVSINSQQSEIIKEAIQAGVKIINNATFFINDKKNLDLLQKNPELSLIFIHQTAQFQRKSHFGQGNIVLDVYDNLKQYILTCREANIDQSRIAIDVGLGLGKSTQNDLALIGRLSLFKNLGCAVLLNASRKDFIAAVGRDVPSNERLCGSVATALWAVNQRVDLLKTHDVRETRQALDVWQSIQNASY